MTAYAGPVEALTFEEAAVRLRISVDHLRAIYTGRVIHLGSLPRIYAAHLHAWLDDTGAETLLANDSWHGVGERGDAEEGAPSKRKTRAAS